MRVLLCTIGAIIILIAVAVFSFGYGARIGVNQAESNSKAGSVLTHALQLDGDLTTARLLRDGAITNALRRVEGDILLNATLLGIVVSPDSTDAATADDALRALASMDVYIAETRSPILSNRRSSDLLARTHIAMTNWLQTLTNGPTRSTHGIAFDRTKILPWH